MVVSGVNLIWASSRLNGNLFSHLTQTQKLNPQPTTPDLFSQLLWQGALSALLCYGHTQLIKAGSRKQSANSAQRRERLRES